MTQMSIRFGTSPGIVAPLEIEAPRGGPPLQALCAVLFSMRVQVLAAEEEQRTDGLIQRLRVCEFDGGPLSTRRRRTIAAALGGEQESVRAQGPIASSDSMRAA
jgi:hypothetical protein